MLGDARYPGGKPEHAIGDFIDGCVQPVVMASSCSMYGEQTQNRPIP
ncbi:hypothetical protein I552_0163 [Mycobacterium xenopi 3993]|nr:hypothetical protein I552_0163 [Mycobacterium xenopi 3993]